MTPKSFSTQLLKLRTVSCCYSSEKMNKSSLYLGCKCLEDLRCSPNVFQLLQLLLSNNDPFYTLLMVAYCIHIAFFPLLKTYLRDYPMSVDKSFLLSTGHLVHFVWHTCTCVLIYLANVYGDILKHSLLREGIVNSNKSCHFLNT